MTIEIGTEPSSPTGFWVLYRHGRYINQAYVPRDKTLRPDEGLAELRRTAREFEQDPNVADIVWTYGPKAEESE